MHFSEKKLQTCAVYKLFAGWRLTCCVIRKLKQQPICSTFSKEQCSKVARGSWALNQLKHFVDEQTLRSVYHCLIYSHLQYCISSWGTASKSRLAPLFILQKRSIRLLTESGYREHTNPLFYRAK